jgi:hypothetical protein
MTADIESIRAMLKEASDRGDFSKYDSAQVIFALGRLLAEVDRLWSKVDRLWSKYPTEADHTWKGGRNDN